MAAFETPPKPSPDEQIAKRLAQLFNVPSLEGDILKVVEKKEAEDEIEVKQRNDLLRWITQLEARLGLLDPGQKLPPQNTLQKQKGYDDFLDIRRQVVTAIIKGMNRERSNGLNEAREDAFLPPKDGQKGKLISVHIQEIQELINNIGEPKSNKLFVWDNPNLPLMKKIDKEKAYIDQVLTLGGIDPNALDKDRAATRKYLENMKAQLALIENIDPIVAAQHQILKRYKGGPLDKAGRLLLLAVGAIMGMISLTILAKKKLNKEKISGSDIVITSGWLGLMAVALKYNPLKGKDQMNEVAKIAVSVYSDTKFDNLVGKIGQTEAVAAIKELGGILANNNSETELKAKIDERNGISINWLSKFITKPEESELLAALTKLEFDKDRRYFLSKCHTLKIGEESNRTTMIGAILAQAKE